MWPQKSFLSATMLLHLAGDSMGSTTEAIRVSITLTIWTAQPQVCAVNSVACLHLWGWAHGPLGIKFSFWKSAGVRVTDSCLDHSLLPCPSFLEICSACSTWHPVTTLQVSPVTSPPCKCSLFLEKLDWGPTPNACCDILKESDWGPLGVC